MQYGVLRDYKTINAAIIQKVIFLDSWRQVTTKKKLLELSIDYINILVKDFSS